MKKIIIIGSGGVGREVAWIIEDINNKEQTYEILGFVDDCEEKKGQVFDGNKVLGNFEYLITNLVGEDVRVVIAISNCVTKSKIAKKLEGVFEFETIIHPSALYKKGTNIGVGTIVYPLVIISVNVSIGKHVLICSKTGIGHDTSIGDYSSIFWNVNLSGNVLVAEKVLIGTSASVIQGLEIGEKSVIGSGSVVIRNIKSESKNVGVPSREIG